MALVDIIANSGNDVKNVFDRIRQGAADKRAQGTYETTQTLNNLKIGAIEKANEKEAQADTMRQELANTRGRDKRQALMQKAIDLGFGKMVTDNQNAVKKMDSTQLQVRGNQNSQIILRMDAIEQMNDPVRQEEAYQELVAKARSFEYEGKLAPTYLEARKNKSWERERILARLSKEDFKRKLDTRKQGFDESYKKRRLGQFDRRLSIMEQANRDKNTRAQAAAYSKMAKAASKAAGKDIKFTGAQFAQYSSSVINTFDGLDVKYVGTGIGEDTKIKHAEATRDYGINYRKLSRKYSSSTASNVAKAMLVNRLVTTLSGSDDYNTYGASPGSDAKGRPLYSIMMIKRYARGEVTTLNGRKGVYFTNWLALDKSNRPKIQFFPMNENQLELYEQDY